MPERPECIPAPLVVAEARAAAHQLRAIAARLLAMAHLLPLPPEEELDQLLERASEQTFKDYPLLSLFVDVETLVRDHLLPTADALEEAAANVE
jgi:ribosome assembly protein YihI (activator of Der GTPase)